MLRVLTVPLKLSPDLVKLPMVAMVSLLFALGTAPIAASMAIDRPEAIGAARAGAPQRSGGRRRASFLSREDGGPAARGRKLTGAVAARRSRRQPAFGQIKP
jgi:hypothetical protein